MKVSYKVLFVGGVFLERNEEVIKKCSKGAIQNAANKLQWNYINGLEANLSSRLDLLNSVFVGTYPKYYTKAVVKGGGRFNDSNERLIYDVGFINLPILSEKTKYITLKKAFKEWVKKNQDAPLYIIAYGLFEQNVRLLSFAKKNYNAITCLIIPDLPQYMSLDRKLSSLKRLFLSHINKVFENNKQNIDYYSLVTEQMGESLDISNDKYVVIDGMTEINKKVENRTDESESSRFSFLYTGGLSSSYGTDLLVESFLEMSNKQAELWICGDGPYLDELQSICKTEPRIHYFGVLSQTECTELQHKASCLVNPRQDSDITKYSFPSKTMEYLASGKPVIAKRLLGMSKEYEDFFFQFKDSNDLKNVMNEVCLKEKAVLHKAGLKGKQFVEEKKNNIFQTNKLVMMLSIKKGENHARDKRL